MVTPVPIIAFPIVDTPETFRLPLTSASVTVAIPVLMLGTSSSPNNLPVNTTSPLIVCEDAAPTIAFCTVNLSNI